MPQERPLRAAFSMATPRSSPMVRSSSPPQSMRSSAHTAGTIETAEFWRLVVSVAFVASLALVQWRVLRLP